MKPSRFSTSSTFERSFEAGLITTCLRALCPLRIRVSISPRGSLIAMDRPPSSPARLDDARDQPGRAEVAQCDTRHLELAVDTAGTTGQLTAVPDADPRTVPRHLRQGDGSQEPFFTSEERCCGKAGVRTCRSRGSTDIKTKK